MGVTFEGPAVFVADIAASREFYETILGQAVAADHGPHVAFAGGFSIWQADCALSVIFEDGAVLPEAAGRERFELYFESDDLEAAWERAEALTEEADLFLVLGSSLQVAPANLLPRRAAARGAKLVILNGEPTPLDGLADLVLRGGLGENLGDLRRRVGALRG